MKPSDLITSATYQACADATISPPHVAMPFRPKQEWNPIKVSQERHTLELGEWVKLARELADRHVIFVYADHLRSFLTRVFPLLSHRFVLISYGDVCIEPWAFEFLEDKFLAHMFATNCRIGHPKLTPIPMGIPADGAADVLCEVTNAMVSKGYMAQRIWACFSLNTNPVRQSLIRRLATTEHVIKCAHAPRHTNYVDTSDSMFTLSPPGAGPDCFRTWEALYLGSIPVVERWSVGSPYYSLPVVQMDDLGVISIDTIASELRRMKWARWPWLDPHFWQKYIREISADALDL